LKRIKCLFNFAVNKYEIILKSPIKNIEYEKTRIKEKKALTDFELKKLLLNLKTLKTIKTIKPYISSLLASKCGLRIGEICGLTWDNIDFDNKLMIINKQWGKNKSGIWEFKKLKSFKSYRTVPIPYSVIKELVILKQSYPININNRILNINNKDAFSSNIKKIYKKSGFNISIHELRHTYATNLIAKGIDFKTAAKLLGHDVKQTMNTYSHVNDDMFNNAKNIIEKFF
jgi:integrase